MQRVYRLMGDRMLDLNSNNFLSWKARIDKILDGFEFPGGHQSEPSKTSRVYDEWILCSANGCVTIGTLVTQRLLQQVDSAAKSQHLKLLTELERLTYTFRFMDLPPEIRNRVYCCCMPLGKEIVIAPLRRAQQPVQQKQVFHYPAITAVSQQIHSEALPLLYTRCVFILDFTASATLRKTQRVEAEKGVDISQQARN